MLFLSLPTDLLADILTKWLHIRDVGRLDSAHCNKAQRNELLQFLDNDTLVFPMVISVWKGMLEWVLRRRVRMEGFVFERNFNLLFESTTNFIALNGQHISNLCFNSCDRETLLDPLTDVSFACPNLQIVSFGKCEIKSCIRGILTGCKKLYRLHFENCTNISDTCVAKIHCPSITQLVMKDCATDSALTAFANACPNLLSLELEQGSLTDASFIAIADNCPALMLLTIESVCAISDVAVVSIAKKCSSIVYIEMRNCARLTNSSIEALAQNCSNLKEITVVGSCTITDAALIRLARELWWLSKLILDGCSRITDVGIIAVAEHRKLLTELSLSGMRNVTNTAVLAIANSCTKITKLNISDTKVTDEGIAVIAQKSVQLRELICKRCSLLTERGYFTLTHQFPQLTSLTVSVKDSMITPLTKLCVQQCSPKLTLHRAND